MHKKRIRKKIAKRLKKQALEKILGIGTAPDYKPSGWYDVISTLDGLHDRMTRAVEASRKDADYFYRLHYGLPQRIHSNCMTITINNSVQIEPEALEKLASSLAHEVIIC